MNREYKTIMKTVQSGKAVILYIKSDIKSSLLFEKSRIRIIDLSKFEFNYLQKCHKRFSNSCFYRETKTLEYNFDTMYRFDRFYNLCIEKWEIL